MLNLPFTSVAFLNPWILSGLLALPIIWFLLRVFPPVPRMVHLPGAWLLEGLVPDRQTTSKTPWWLILLRTVLAALIILSLAHPVVNPAESLNLRGSLRLVIDNDWSAAQTWSRQVQSAEQYLDRAARDRLQVFILTTTPEPGQTDIVQQGPMTAAQAQTIVRGLRPRPWPATYGLTANSLAAATTKSGIDTVWLSTGLDNGSGNDLASTLQQQGSLTYVEPDAANRALLLLPRVRAGQDLSVAVNAAAGVPDKMPVGVDALAADGRILDHQTATLISDDLPAEVKFSLPDALRGQVSQFRLSARNGAGSIVLMDNQFSRKTVGILTSRDESKSAPLVESGYYLSRALEPYADLRSGELDDLLKQKGLSVIILPDIGALPAETLDTLEKWVKGGGLLLRLAGPNMSKAENFLTPTPLRKGERALNGALTWDKPQKLAPFPKASPLYGLDVPPEIEVKQQILPEPIADLDKKTWAALQDGTPLVTAAPLDKGLIVLIHTTATPAWSNLALSGLYVQMLQRIVGLAGLQDITGIADGTLHPQKILDGMGALVPPDSTVQPIDAKKFAAQMPDSIHPPGFYGRTGVSKVFNLGDRIKTLTPMGRLPLGVTRVGYTGGNETDLMPWLLALAFILFLCDWIIMLVLQGIGSNALRSALRGGAVVVLCLLPLPAQAQDSSADAIRQASAIHLAYIQSGVATIDSTAQKGLENLSRILNERTSVEPAGVVAINLSRDDISFFPLIYWPISGSEQPMTQDVAQKVQYYLDHGGTILFDTRNPTAENQNTSALKNLTSGLDVPPLVQAPKDHVLTKAFYLLRSFPGRYDNTALWVEEASASGRDGVSSVLVGGNDWASAWGGFSPPEGSNQQEIALRFGVNLVMYTLTGN
ncbi:MAG: putative rane protein, partial [Micavibrio sp.]|nr:putative rane protein [Micavibrio sp.]